MLFLPILAITGYGATAMMPLLAVVAAVKVAENSTDYSLQNTIQQALFLPTSRDAKYKAKSAIDSFGVRLGDLLSTALVFVGSQLKLSLKGFALANVAIGLVWLWIALQVRRRQMVLVEATAPAEDSRSGDGREPSPAVQRAAVVALNGE